MQHLKHQIDLVRNSVLFDRQWYLDAYPDVAQLGMEPAEHFVRLGARLLRNPGPRFDTAFYLARNADVAKSGLNPLVHYIEHGFREHRAATPHVLERGDVTPAVDVVVPVFNALEDVQRCLHSLQDRKDGLQVRVLVVNDGSDQETSAWLADFCGKAEDFQLLQHDRNRGYTCAVNTGLEASTAGYVVTLNSDTIVTRGWLRGMIRCMESTSRIGIVGPLSNAASWQNVPDLLGGDGTFAVNKLPPNCTPDDMATLVAKASTRSYPRLPFINGFCFMIRRQVLDAIGYMDVDGFPVGYGEENDFCIRAADAGFELAVADDAYVFHAKSKSFGHDRRKELSRQGADTLRRKHSASRYEELVSLVKKTEALDRVRERVARAIASRDSNHAPVEFMNMRILFLLPVKGGGGGAHSVVQEVTEMRRLGVPARIAIRREHLPSFLEQYADIPTADEVFVGFEEHDLGHLADDYDVVVATIFSSMQLVDRIVQENPHILPAYYVQDYEPLFFPRGSSHWKVARASYELVPGAALFAKTRWIASQVRQEHGVDVHKVEPSIDHAVYRPLPKLVDGRIHVAAMIRPQTPRRGAERTMRLFANLHELHPDKFAFHLFGCAEESAEFQALEQGFPFTSYGVLKRPEVASLLAKCDVFVDLSDYQAFGRTSLEAMACGCVSMVPVHGGGDEYAIDGVNALVVDTFDHADCLGRLCELAEDTPRIRSMQLAGVRTAAGYSVHAAAVSECSLLAHALASHRELHPLPIKRKLVLMPHQKRSGEPFDPGYHRVRSPYLTSTIRARWRVETAEHGILPNPGSADVVLIQRDLPLVTSAQLEDWNRLWQAEGGRILFETDDPGAGQLVGSDSADQASHVPWLVRTADVVTVPASDLAEALGSIEGSKVRTIPHRLDASLWKLDAPRDHAEGSYARTPNRIRIGYFATTRDDDSIDALAGVFQRLRERYGDSILIEVIGAAPRAALGGVNHVPWPRRRDYPHFVDWLLRRVHWDIGVLSRPLTGADASLAFIEHAALDMAIACSAGRPFRATARDAVNCRVVEDNDDAWVDVLSELIDHPEQRAELAMRARQDVRDSHSIAANGVEYVRLLDAAYSSHAHQGGGTTARPQRLGASSAQ